jgi:peptidylprolyl isomerase
MKACCALVAVACSLAFFGCGSSGDSATSAETSPEPKDSSTTASAERKARYPVPSVPPQKEPLERLIVKDLRVGDGPVARWGDEVSVRYVGLYYDTGKMYSQHWGSTYEFKLDGETVGPGWQKGIHGMRVGGRRETLIPARLIFGGSDGDLAYYLELRKVKHGDGGEKSSREAGRPSADSYQQEGPFAAITVRVDKEKPDIDSPDRPAPKKLLVRDLEEGSGPTAHRGDLVDIEYHGAIYKTGELRFGGSTQPFKLGFDGLGKPFERGIEGMKAGGRRELILPSRFIGGSPAVDYVIEMISVQPAHSG